VVQAQLVRFMAVVGLAVALLMIILEVALVLLV
jgi:hypothetical protein